MFGNPFGTINLSTSLATQPRTIKSSPETSGDYEQQTVDSSFSPQPISAQPITSVNDGLDVSPKLIAPEQDPDQPTQTTADASMPIVSSDFRTAADQPSLSPQLSPDLTSSVYEQPMQTLPEADFDRREAPALDEPSRSLPSYDDGYLGPSVQSTYDAPVLSDGRGGTVISDVNTSPVMDDSYATTMPEPSAYDQTTQQQTVDTMSYDGQDSYQTSIYDDGAVDEMTPEQQYEQQYEQPSPEIVDNSSAQHPTSMTALVPAPSTMPNDVQPNFQYPSPMTSRDAYAPSAPQVASRPSGGGSSMVSTYDPGEGYVPAGQKMADPGDQGMVFMADQPPSGLAPVDDERRRKMMLYAGLGVAGLGAAALVYYLYTREEKK